jgi:hypothetical protein
MVTTPASDERRRNPAASSVSTPLVGTRGRAHLSGARALTASYGAASQLLYRDEQFFHSLRFIYGFRKEELPSATYRALWLAGCTRGRANWWTECRTNTEVRFKSTGSCGGPECPGVDAELFGESSER